LPFKLKQCTLHSWSITIFTLVLILKNVTAYPKSLIKTILEGSFPSVTIKGEISNFRPSSTGHYYFSLKDQESIISIVMFKSSLSRLEFLPQDGMLVRARGSISVYAKRGSYQLICEELIKAGEGNIFIMLEERKRRLAEQGLFAQENKKPLPLLPSHIVIITSPTGAALKDILRVLRRRHSGINLTILPTPVQGDEAASVIASRIRTANTYQLGDVIIVGRGGGSLEDLLPFSDEEVVRTIAASELPIISAVGHEIDTVLSDLAADVRAPTPSAAAELVSASRDQIHMQVREIKDMLLQYIKQQAERIRLTLSHFSIENQERYFRTFIQPLYFRLDDAKEQLLYAMRDYTNTYHHKLELLAHQLKAHSPIAVLSRGYAVVTDKHSKKIIKSYQDTQHGKELSIRLHKGSIDAEVKETHNHG
jgi:exodeoxyribonuclease VII large subunit